MLIGVGRFVVLGTLIAGELAGERRFELKRSLLKVFGKIERSLVASWELFSLDLGWRSREIEVAQRAVICPRVYVGLKLCYQDGGRVFEGCPE